MKNFLIVLSAIFLSNCGTPKVVQTPDEPIGDIQDLPEMVVFGDEHEEETPEITYPYRAAVSRPWDLVHTRLNITFDWDQQYVLGKANLIMTPFASRQDSIILDAVGFLIHDVRLNGFSDTLAYIYDNAKLKIKLPRAIQVRDTLNVAIAYTARPEENITGGSAAITSDKGLYFINPTRQYRDKPSQIWTQGETQSNSRWFPTFDQPNERCTQELLLTVDTIYETLSNGLMVDRRVHENGTRTDVWRMDLPHAPYLFMIAVGEYAVISETWEKLPLSYYVEKPYAAHAKAIFPDAPSMIGFFQDYVGYPYPWPKYSQVVVRDFVSGAMENTTAVVYGEFVQSTERELLDEKRNQIICAHELIHHWFGDLVTCESWSNLVLNEGFANYGEYLWMEFKYGPDEAEHHRRQELAGYLGEAEMKKRPLVDFHYAQQEDMFDAHSYNKGGLVLHMLRHYLGDGIFRAGIKRYLHRHAFQAVDVHDLRRAMEFVSGQDLNWFFNQWFYQPGHPTLDWTWTFDEINQVLEVTVSQLQDPTQNAAKYVLPTELLILLPRDKTMRLPMNITEDVQTFTWHLEEAPILLDIDPERVLLADINRGWTGEAAAAYWRVSPGLWSRQDILNILEDEAAGLQPAPWNDRHWSIRAESIRLMDPYEPVQQLTLSDLARNDPHSSVRATALMALTGSGFPGYRKLVVDLLQKDPSLDVAQIGLSGLAADHPEEAKVALERLQTDTSVIATLVVGDFMSNFEVGRNPAWFVQAWERINGYPRMLFVKMYADVLSTADRQDLDQGISLLVQDALAKDVTPLRRFAAFRALTILRQLVIQTEPELAEDLHRKILEIRDQETDEGLLPYYLGYE